MMRMGWSSRAAFLIVTLLIAFGSGGCSPDREAVAPDGIEPADTDIVALLVDAEWLSGSWTVNNTLDAVSSEVFLEEVGDEVITVAFSVEGQEMTVRVDDMTFLGVVVFGDENFRFEGAARYVEGDGSQTDSDMVVDGIRTGEASWEATTYAEVRSDGEYVYEVSWIQSAVRSE